MSVHDGRNPQSFESQPKAIAHVIDGACARLMSLIGASAKVST